MAGKRTPPPSFWPKVPVDPRYGHWLTVPVERRVLVVVRTVTTLTRLLDILSLLEDDRRIQVVFTFDSQRPAIFSAGVPEFLSALEAPVISWEQAVSTPFDLAIAASENDDLKRLQAPVLLVSHGIGHQKYYPRGTVISGLNPARLLDGDRPVVARIGLSHTDQLRHLPEAVAQRASVIGDPCHDRMLASTHRVPEYRRRLGIGARTHVVLASTWGPDSLLGSRPDLPERLLAALPADEYAVSLILHPGAWVAHGPLQLRSWLARARRGGLAVVPPQHGWQATLLAASVCVSDCGSMPLYATAAGLPVLIGSRVSPTVVAGSPLAGLLQRASRLDHDADLRTQLDEAIARGPVSGVVEQAIEFPGKCAELLRPVLYDLMDLPEPTAPAVFDPVADPAPEKTSVSAFRVGVQASGDVLVITRFPAGIPGSPLPGQHFVAHAELATLAELDGAAIVHRELDDDFRAWASSRTRLAAGIGSGVCLLWSSGRLTELRAEVDPLVLASAAHWRLTRNLPLAGTFRVRVGLREAEVTARTVS